MRYQVKLLSGVYPEVDTYYTTQEEADEAIVRLSDSFPIFYGQLIVVELSNAS